MEVTKKPASRKASEFDAMAHQELQGLLDGHPAHPKFAQWVSARQAICAATHREKWLADRLAQDWGL